RDHRTPNRRDARAPQPRPRAGAAQGSGLAASAVGFLAVAAVGGAVAWASGCHNEAPPGPSSEMPSRPASLPPPVSSVAAAKRGADPKRPAAAASASAAPAADAPYTGPLLGGLALQTMIYPAPEFSKTKVLGYIRLGGKVPVDPKPIKKENCTAGWYHLVDGGYVCGKYATTDMSSPQVKLGIHPPNIEDVLPYKYAYNTADGTPLYRSVPSKEEMLKYEPYLDKKKKKKKDRDADKEEGRDKAKDVAEVDKREPSIPEGDSSARPASTDLQAAQSVGILTPPPDEPARPWYDHDPKEKIQVKLADLEADSDSTMAKRMVKGFFVAVDKTFGWNNRTWYKTTGALVAPADRMYLVKPPTTVGMEFAEGVKQIGFITSRHSSKYEIAEGGKDVKVLGPIARMSAFGLTGATVTQGGTVFRQTTEGWWMKAVDGTYTDPGPRPADLAAGEKWIDVNLTRKTLVAFDGDKPWYAALVSPGKKSKNKEKDHRTIQGTFRIREKHIAVTMDGDGKTASDLPYSIEDVPYVQYFEGSYALHGAFWHNNFGHEMSHGCVNLSPLDAKKIFYWSEPKLPRGWHAVWATPEHRGTVVVVHE
ncbi:MAG TPA: L,D-transpeptidase, partial [Minicystis sp.]|nr:L,D-transpeptidase [Minicystis sp.]